MYLIQTPTLIQHLFPNFTWRIATLEKKLFLTFDDGPIPVVTPWVVSELAKYAARATFFCVGENVRKHPKIFVQLRAAGHAVGNHTFNHLNGWTTDNATYLQNVAAGTAATNSRLFRPPYGRLKPQQVRGLRPQHRIIMWDVLSGDFDPKLSPERCANNVLHSARPGSIIVMHDSLKAERNLRFALPRILDHFSQHGFTFAALNESL